MKTVVILAVVCVAFFIQAASAGRCKTNSDCGANECCYGKLVRHCRTYALEGEKCSFSRCGCAPDLDCEGSFLRKTCKDNTPGSGSFF
ncbi:U8-theraphotoxin-Hhn1d-like [Hydractinia symbiolongicarpus]|uniref:U8-theraphotoxin-Hhn1d-like n=1 Tax=Hydractinia symbiolongicarpus TaxID=13093 RepID=UPI00254B3A78|nr:U8-theraphotoxin-Hhn1d-like [Hydractinia symbiolongicarpus]